MSGSMPVWAIRGEAHTHLYRLATPLAELGAGDSLWSTLGQRPIALLALVQFLRSLPLPVDLRVPPLRAAFMFDDPNLRWRSYGFIDYQRLVAHADTHGYHAAMAMIPLDAGVAHAPTAGLFARRPDRLSLLVHGNDHIRSELRALSNPQDALAAAAQAERRMARFERRYHIRIDRVMAPPHGSCSVEMSRALGAVGFEALCGHPPGFEQAPIGRPVAGWRPAEFVGGCAAIPRIPLSSSRSSIALRAFLNHPLIIYGHHQDVAPGLERLEEVAASVNALGTVHWSSLREIARTNVEVSVSGERANVRAASRRMRLDLGPTVTSLQVEPPEDLLEDGRLAGWSLDGGPLRSFNEAAHVPRGRGLDLRLHGQADVNPSEVPGPVWRPGPKLRRLAVEARDRVWPLASAVGVVR